MVRRGVLCLTEVLCFFFLKKKMHYCNSVSFLVLVLCCYGFVIFIGCFLVFRSGKVRR